jgi:hypothetical protein
MGGSRGEGNRWVSQDKITDGPGQFGVSLASWRFKFYPFARDSQVRFPNVGTLSFQVKMIWTTAEYRTF